MEKKEISVGIFEPVAEMTGGAAYRKAMCDALAKRYDVQIFNVAGNKGILPSARFRRIREIAKITQAKDVWIRDFYPVTAMSIRRNPGKNIGLFLHLYTEAGTRYPLGWAFEYLFLRNIRKCDRVVAISNFWKDYLRDLGVGNVRVILNGMDISEFQFEQREVEAFRRKHGLTDSPVVYIGNCLRNKGVVESYEALKDRGYHLVTSGEPDVHVPCPNFNLPYREYLLLLKASAVAVTMSKFREGWCRTAHEAMLCKTPVIGSGAGGMAELLDGGKQYICRDFSELPHLVEAAIRQRENVGEQGYKFVSALTKDRFEREWSGLVEEVVHDDSQLE